MASQRSASANSGMPEDVQTLMQKYRRMKSFIDQYEEEWELLVMLKEVCSVLVSLMTKEMALRLYGPGLPCKSSQLIYAYLEAESDLWVLPFVQRKSKLKQT